jgi:hypothetical protein
MRLYHPVMFYTFNTSFSQRPLAFVPIYSAVLIAPSFSSPFEIFSETVVKAKVLYYLAAAPINTALFLASSIISSADILPKLFSGLTNYTPAIASGAIGGALPALSSLNLIIKSVPLCDNSRQPWSLAVGGI